LSSAVILLSWGRVERGLSFKKTGIGQTSTNTQLDYLLGKFEVDEPALCCTVSVYVLSKKKKIENCAYLLLLVILLLKVTNLREAYLLALHFGQRMHWML